MQSVYHACESTTGAQLYFQAHNKVQCEKNIIGTWQAQRFDKGLRKIMQLRRFHEPDKKSACEHTGTNGYMTPQHQDNNRHSNDEQNKNIHKLLPFVYKLLTIVYYTLFTADFLTVCEKKLIFF